MSYGDQLSGLPVDNTQPSPEEIQLATKIFPEKTGIMNTIFSELKGAMIVAILFVILTLPIVDRFIKSCVTATENSEIILIGVKAFLMGFLYYISVNFGLIRK